MDIDTSVLGDHGLVGLIGVIVGGIVRAFDDDTKLPTVPARFRAAFALILGIVLGFAAGEVIGGFTWKRSLSVGVLAAGLAILGNSGLSLAKGPPRAFARVDSLFLATIFGAVALSFVLSCRPAQVAVDTTCQVIRVADDLCYVLEHQDGRTERMSGAQLAGRAGAAPCPSGAGK